MDESEQAERLQEFLRDYEKYHAEVLQPTFNEIREPFLPWKDDQNYWAAYIDKNRLPVPSPVHRVRPNIKRPESVVDKILRKPADFPDGLSAKSLPLMNDCEGSYLQH